MGVKPAKAIMHLQVKVEDRALIGTDLCQKYKCSPAIILQVYEQLFSDASPERIQEAFSSLDENNTGFGDYLEWSKRVDLKDVPAMAKNCRVAGPLYQSSLTEEEFRQLRRMMRRLHDLADAASKVCPLPDLKGRNSELRSGLLVGERTRKESL